MSDRGYFFLVAFFFAFFFVVFFFAWQPHVLHMAFASCHDGP